MRLNHEQKKYINFGLIFTGIFVVTFIVLYALGFVPEELLSNGNSPANALKLNLLQSGSTNQNQVVATKDIPTKIQIDK